MIGWRLIVLVFIVVSAFALVRFPSMTCSASPLLFCSRNKDVALTLILQRRTPDPEVDHAGAGAILVARSLANPMQADFRRAIPKPFQDHDAKVGLTERRQIKKAKKEELRLWEEFHQHAAR